MAYAENTSVPISRSREEIQRILQKYGASGFLFGEGQGNAMIVFEIRGKRIKFVLPLAVYMKDQNHKRIYFGEEKIAQMNRAKWRALVLAIKAKLECVEAGITTLEQEFLAHIVLPNGQTMGQIAIPQIEASYRDKSMPPLLGHSQ